MTGVLKNGTWIDPAPLDAARSLLQVRYDLKLGIWDLATNHTLRATLLKETPVPAPPSPHAKKPADVLHRQQQWRARPTDYRQRRNAASDRRADLVRPLGTPGWTTLSPGAGDVNPMHHTRRSLPLAVAPDCDDTESRARHPAVRPGSIIFWLQFELQGDDPFRFEVKLVVPAPLSSLHEEIFSPFYRDHIPALEKIAKPNRVRQGYGLPMRGTRTYHLALYDGGDRVDQVHDIDVAERIKSIAEMTPAWVELFAPLAKRCRDAITANPRLGRT